MNEVVKETVKLQIRLKQRRKELIRQSFIAKENGNLEAQLYAKGRFYEVDRLINELDKILNVEKNDRREEGEIKP